MDERKYSLIDRAFKKHGIIFPCASKSNFDDCFTVDENRIIFWFNTEDHSTHVLAEY